MKKIYFLTKKYPNHIDINALSFVQQLVWTIADLGYDCSVICPLPVNINSKYKELPDMLEETTENGTKVNVFYPKCLGFGDSHLVFGKSPIRVTTYFFQKAVECVVKKIGIPDAFYGHFIAPPGIVAAKLGKKYNVPSYFAYGEAKPIAVDWYGKNEVIDIFKSLSGVVAVSTKNKKEIIETGAVEGKKVSVFPNGYREERFYPRNKQKAREKYGFPLDAFIVSFVGSFDERKGILRLEKAVDQIDNCFMICAGKGGLQPTSAKCLWKAPVDNAELPEFLSASDLFVLPTLNEGCCNAIIEAMACGLPIISSEDSFNDDILDESCSIRVDSNDVEAIKNAIKSLMNNKVLLQDLSTGSINKTKELTLKGRAQKIVRFMEKYGDE